MTSHVVKAVTLWQIVFSSSFRFFFPDCLQPVTFVMLIYSFLFAERAQKTKIKFQTQQYQQQQQQLQQQQLHQPSTSVRNGRSGADVRRTTAGASNANRSKSSGAVPQQHQQRSSGQGRGRGHAVHTVAASGEHNKPHHRVSVSVWCLSLPVTRL